MRDKRLNWPNQVFRSSITSGSSASDTLWNSDKTITNIVSLWWDELFKMNPRYKRESEIIRPNDAALDRIIKTSREVDQIPKEFHDAFENWLENRNPGSALYEKCGLVVAAVGAKKIARLPLKFDLSAQFLSYQSAYVCFMDELSKQILSGPKPGRIKWAKFLSAFGDLPFSLVECSRGEDRILQGILFEDSRSSGRPITFDTIWSAENRGHLRGNRLAMNRLSLLRAIDFDGFLKFFDSIPTIEVKGMVFRELSLDHDPDLIRRWIQVAPKAFDKLGLPARSSTCLFGVNAVVDYVRAVQHAVAYTADKKNFGASNQELVAKAASERNGVETEELPRFLTDMFELTAKRPDGLVILIDLAMELIHRTIYMKPREQKGKMAWVAEEQAVESIAKLLGTHKDSTKIIRRRFDYIHEQSERLGRVSPGNLVLLSILSQNEKSFESVEIWDWYTDLLFLKNRSIISHVNRFSQADPWVFDLFGSVLIRLKNPAESVNIAWDGLFHQRFTARFKSAFAEELDACRHLVLVLLGALNHLFNLAERDKELEVTLLQMAIRFAWTLYFSYGEATFVDDSTYIARAFCYIPYVFESKWNDPVNEYLGHLTDEPELAVRLAASLAANKLPAADVANEFQKLGFNLPTMIGEIENWYERSGRKEKVPFDLLALKNTFGDFVEKKS